MSGKVSGSPGAHSVTTNNTPDLAVTLQQGTHIPNQFWWISAWEDWHRKRGTSFYNNFAMIPDLILIWSDERTAPPSHRTILSWMYFERTPQCGVEGLVFGGISWERGDKRCLEGGTIPSHTPQHSPQWSEYNQWMMTEPQEPTVKLDKLLDSMKKKMRMKTSPLHW